MRSLLVFCVACLGCGTTANVTGQPGSTASVGGGAGGNAATAGSGGMTANCAAALLPAGKVTSQSMAFGGYTRHYDVQVPASYDNRHAVPLVFDLHGYTSNKDQQALISGFSQLAEQEGFVVVRPNGLSSNGTDVGVDLSWNGGDTCCGYALQHKVDDSGLMKAIAQAVQKQLCIDPKRIYATGLSNGGALSHRLACDEADWLAMTAPVSFPLDYEPASQCRPARPISVMHFHGYNDIVVPYQGGGAANAISAADSFADWAKIDGCTGEPVVTYMQGGSSCASYPSCQGGAEVTLCSLQGGHVLYANQDNVPIAKLAWAEMKKHPLP